MNTTNPRNRKAQNAPNDQDQRPAPAQTNENQSETSAPVRCIALLGDIISYATGYQPTGPEWWRASSSPSIVATSGQFPDSSHPDTDTIPSVHLNSLRFCNVSTVSVREFYKAATGATKNI